MHKEIRDRVAIVTGGTRGIGRAIAARLLQEGAKVAICGTRQESIAEAVASLAAGPEKLFGAVADVSRLDEVRQFVNAVKDRFDGIHILVNNAGSGTFASAAELAPAEWEHMIGINLTGAYYCCHEVLPVLMQGGGGDIINIGSLAGKNPFAGGAGYNASKFGLNGFTEALMLDHRNDGIRASTIMPGSVDTDFGGQPGSGAKSGNEWKIAPEDIAEIVVHLLRMDARTTISRVEVRPSRPAKS